jgi:hypothetical protein
MEPKARMMHQSSQVGLFDLARVVGYETVDPDDVVAVGQQLFRHM